MIPFCREHLGEVNIYNVEAILALNKDFCINYWYKRVHLCKIGGANCYQKLTNLCLVNIINLITDEFTPLVTVKTRKWNIYYNKENGRSSVYTII